MKKNVLVPTDFSVESLNTVKSILQNRPETTRYHIVLLHGLRMSDSITELLFYSKARLLESLTERSFKEACGILKNKYTSGIAALYTDLFSGQNQAAFDAYLEANDIEAVYVPARYRLQPTSPKSIDLLPFINKCPVPVEKIEWNMEAVLPEKGSLAEIFYNGATAS